MTLTLQNCSHGAYYLRHRSLGISATSAVYGMSFLSSTLEWPSVSVTLLCYICDLKFTADLLTQIPWV